MGGGGCRVWWPRTGYESLRQEGVSPGLALCSLAWITTVQLVYILNSEWDKEIIGAKKHSSMWCQNSSGIKEYPHREGTEMWQETDYIKENYKWVNILKIMESRLLGIKLWRQKYGKFFLKKKIKTLDWFRSSWIDIWTTSMPEFSTYVDNQIWM